MDLIFAYIAGLLTLINPCVLPVLPIVLATAASGDRRGPVYLAAGMSVSFVIVGLGLIVFGNAIGLNERNMATIGAWAMVGFGLVLMVPQLSARFATATAGFAARADEGFEAGGQRQGLGYLVGGALLGAVWSPCIGPTLGGAIALASQGQSLGWAGAIMVAFAMGVSTIILALAFGSQAAIHSRRDAMATLAQRARPVMGLAFLLVGVMILTKTHHMIEAWLIGVMPGWLLDLSVAV